MKVIKQVDKEVQLAFNAAESRALRAAFGEVLFGFHLEDFRAAIGTTQEHAKELFEKLDIFDLERENRILLSDLDLRTVRNAHSKTLEELGPEEYETRTGADFVMGQALAKQLDAATQR